MAPLKSKPPDEADDRLIHVRLSAETHRLVRLRVADLDTSIQDWVAGLVEEGLGEEPVSTEPTRGKKAWQRTLSRR